MNVDWKRRSSVSVLALALSMVLAAPGWAQTSDTAAIEGVVRDESGGIVPGATVQVSSPALIEGTRVATTDDAGHYRFLRLPVGTYRVRFSLAGFASVERANVVLNSAFTATINAELKVSALQETLTVTGESPVVDVRTTTTQLVITDDVINSIPSSRNVMDMAKFVVGLSMGRPEVAGSESSSYGTGWKIHGSRGQDRNYTFDGVLATSWFSGGDAVQGYGATGANQEVNYQTTAIPASMSTGGVAMAMVTKSGGANFSGNLFASGFNKGMQSSNLDQALRNRGVRATSGGKQAYDVDGGLGGPILRDKAWFFGSARLWSYTSLLANQFALDGSQAEEYIRRDDEFVKATWQVDKTKRFTLSDYRQNIYNPYRRSGADFVQPEAANINTYNPWNYFVIGSWTGTPSNAWIYELRFSKQHKLTRERYRPEVGPNDVARLDIATSVLSGAPTRIREGTPGNTTLVSGSITRLSNWLGSHELEAGTQYDFGGYGTKNEYHGDIFLRFRNGAPDSVDLLNTPIDSDNRGRRVGIYVQDRWMIANRLTLNIGARYDYLHLYVPDQVSAAGAWVPERRLSAFDVITWNNVVPRIGVAYDLTGAGRTVLRGSFSKYMGNEGVALAESLNPNFMSTNRCAWTDVNGDRYAQANELSRCAGFSGGVTTIVDPELRRPFNREYSLGIDHELAANLKVSIMGYRRENRDLRATRNRAVPFESYIPVVISNPLTNQPLTIYNQNPATTGRQDNILTNSSKLDTTYNGVEISFLRRFAKDTQVSGGYHYGKDLGRIAAGELNDPNADIFAYGAIGDDEPHQFKLLGSTVLPGRISFSGSFIANSGHPRVRQLNVGRDLVPTLTRATQTVRLERNDDVRYDKWVMLDLRVGRVFAMRGVRLEPFVDAYNLTNANTVLTDVTTIGPNLGVVSRTINPRVARVGGKLTF